MTSRLPLSLVSCRAAFRGSSRIAPLILLGVWGPVLFSEYASAVGVCGWVVFVSAGVEQAILKIMPRMPRISPDVARAAMRLSGLPVVMGLAALIVTTGDAHAMTYATAFLWTACVGRLQLMIALHRLRGVAAGDAPAYLGLAVMIALITVCVRAFALAPQWYLLAIAAVTLLTSQILAVLLPRPFFRPGRRIIRPFLRRCHPLGTPEILSGAGLSFCFVALMLTGDRSESGRLYVAALIASVGGALLLYLFRRRPPVSMGFRGASAREGHRRARVAAGRAMAMGGVTVLVLIASTLAEAPADLTLGVMTFMEILTFALTSYAGYLLENTITARAAVAGFAATAITAVPAAAALGAAGVMGAMAIGQAVTAAVIETSLARRYGSRDYNVPTSASYGPVSPPP